MPLARLAHVRRLLALPLIACLGALPAWSADISVDEDCKLAEAIVAANVDVAHGKCTAGSGNDTITLTVDVTLSGALPAITTDMTITGTDQTISGDDKRGIFVIEGADVVVSSLTMSDGLTGTRGGAFHIDGGSLTLTQATVEDNQALDSGGGIYANNANVTLRSSVIKDNVAGRGGGAGIYIAGKTGTHKLLATNSVFTANAASQDGGAIHAAGGTVEIKKSGFQNNSADEGGVIEIWNGKLIMHNTTLHNNSAREGGAINAGADLNSTGSVELVHNTFTGNTASERGGAVAMTGINASLKIGNTWISGTLASGIKHCDPGVSPYTILGNTTNYIADNSCPVQATPTPTPTPEASIQSAAAQAAGDSQLELSAQSAQDELATLKLSSLQQIEGVIYHELLEGNVAIDAADDALCRSLEDPDDDVVNTTRPQGSKCDIGAWEFPVTSTPNVSSPLREPTPTLVVGPPSVVIDPTDDPQDPQDPQSTPDPQATPDPQSTPNPQSTPTPTSVGLVASATPTPVGFVPSPTPTIDPLAPQQAICAHVVVGGDTLYGIALANKTTVQALRALNRLTGDSISVGQVIDLPACHPPAPDDPYICPNAPEGYVVLSVSADVRCAPVVIADIDKHPLMNAGVEQAIDIWGEVEAGTEICLVGEGSLVFEASGASPPQATRLTLFDKDGMQCAVVPMAGRVAHVAPLTDDASIPLTTCHVTTRNVTRLRDAPDGSEILSLVPFNFALDASARTASWFRVEYLDQIGWIDADLVETAGVCD